MIIKKNIFQWNYLSLINFYFFTEVSIFSVEGCHLYTNSRHGCADSRHTTLKT